MKKHVLKFFWDYEKEEAWLNRMASLGLHCVDYYWGRYLFEKGKPGEYTYRIQLLEHIPPHPESTSYLDFLKDAGVETIATHLRWVYLRKKTAEGPFELFSDKESRINHYKKILFMLTPIALVNLIASFIQINLANIINFLMFLALSIPIIFYYRRLTILKKESQIHE